MTPQPRRSLRSTFLSIPLALFVAGCGTTSSSTQTAAPTPAAPTPAAPSAPQAKKEPTTRTLHGEAFVDDYFWMRNKDRPDVVEHLKAEAAYAEAVLAPLKPSERRLYDEIISHINEDDESVPAKEGAWLYWRRLTKGAQYPVHLRKSATVAAADAKEEVLLDVNALAAGKQYMGVGVLEVSDDGNTLLYSTDETGFRVYTLRVLDLKTRAAGSEALERVVQAHWARDGKQVVYTVENDAKRPYRAYLHAIGADSKGDALIYEEKDERYDLYLSATQSKQYIALVSESAMTTEVRLVDAHKPAAAPVVVEPRKEGVRYYVEHWAAKGELFIQANDTGRNFRVATTPVKKPGKSNWKELIAHRDAVFIEGVASFASHLVLQVREAGLPAIDVVDLKTRKSTRVAMPEKDYDVSIDDNREYDVKSVRIRYESLATPKSIFEADLASATTVLLKQDPVPGGFDKSNYVVERIDAQATDGTKIPISIVMKKDVAKDGSAPLHLYGYGSYGYSMPSRFDPARLPLIDRGVIFAVAHIRGGGEMGKIWHEQGRLGNKMNTFRDFIGCAEMLVAGKYTSAAKMTIEGDSAGGLLMGAVINLRPDLWRAAVVGVPFVDVINSMNDATLPLTTQEYEEWGNPTIPEQYQWMRPYSPYDNIEKKSYPAMLVVSSYNDSQVMYWEPAKYVARLRELKTDSQPLLFDIEMDAAGHGGRSGRYDNYQQTARELAFVLWQNGVLKP